MGTTSQETNTLWLIQNAAVIAVSPSLDASREQDDDPQWLAIFQKRLQSSRPKGIWDDTFLRQPDYSLILQFSDGSNRAIAFGAAPVNVIHACRVSINGTERVVLSPGLAEYGAIRNRCQHFEPTDSGQPLEPTNSGMNTTSVVSMIGILLSLLMYLAYVVITQS